MVTKLSSKSTQFSDFCLDVANGISTSCDSIYIVPEAFAKRECFESRHLKPCIRGGQFNRFYCPPETHEFVLYITSDFNPKTEKSIFTYLSQHKKLLIEKCVEKKSGSRDWHILFRSRYTNLFGKPKLLIRQTADRIIAAIDSQVGYYCIDSVNVAILKPSHVERINFFVGLLNSALLNFFYREISQEKGRVLAQVKPQRIKSLPIRDGNSLHKQAITALVDQILATKKRDPKADTTALEREIDRLVYELYGLTGEEIKLVEESRRR